MGYTPCDDTGPETGFRKIAIYAKDSLPTHVAWQLPNGEWTSKCGDMHDITHKLQGLAGDHYGQVVAVMQRPAYPTQQ